MFDSSVLLDHWRYAGIFFAVVFGNLGVPGPEDTILVLAGYAASRGQLRLPIILAVGVASAAIGDNLGYSLGRRYGQGAIERFGRSSFFTAERLQKLIRFRMRYGAVAVFVGRFVPGLRCLAGPLAGAIGVPPLRFTAANVLGALVYVPYAVGLGYGIGWGFGDVIHRSVGGIEHVVLAAIVILTLAFVATRLLRIHHAARSPS